MAKFEQKYSENHENNATTTYPVISVLAVYNLYLVLCFVSLFVCPMSDLNKNTPLTDLPEMLIGELVKPQALDFIEKVSFQDKAGFPSCILAFILSHCYSKLRAQYKTQDTSA